MKLSEYLKGISFQTRIQDPEQMEISGMTSDSRQIAKGNLFVCIRGAKFDGHSAAEQMLEQGAAAVVVERDLGLERQILVENTRSAYAVLCANHFGNPSKKLKLIGVTGTNGKTTITYLVKSILASAGKKVGLMGTIHNEIMDMVIPARYTTPDPFQLHAMLSRMLEAGCEYVVMETSSHALDQHRLDGCHFAVGIFTNLTQDHLDYHGTMENYFEAKKKLFPMCEKRVFNLDDPYGRQLAEEFPENAYTISLEDNRATFTAKSIRSYAGGSKFVFVGERTIERMEIHLPGRFNLSNAMEAAAACIALGMSVGRASAGLASAHGVTGRAEVIPAGQDYTIIRDYAHTPDGLLKITEALHPFAENRLVILFGCAGNRDRTKRPKMAEAAAKNADFVILTSDNPRSEDPIQIINDARPGLEAAGTPYEIIPDRYTAIVWALEHAQPGDILLLAGKGHEDYQVLDEETICFDEREIVLELLKKKQIRETEQNGSSKNQ